MSCPEERKPAERPDPPPSLIRLAETVLADLEKDPTSHMIPPRGEIREVVKRIMARTFQRYAIEDCV